MINHLAELAQLFADSGCVSLYAKPLAENDNSKNQIYLGQDFHSLNILPVANIVADNRSRTPNFKAKLNFSWLLPTGAAAKAEGTQLILYPKYPEVRLSGFLQGCREAPAGLLRERLSGRVLFIGVRRDGALLGHVVEGGSAIAMEFASLPHQGRTGVFTKLALPGVANDVTARSRLIKELCRIHKLGWIDSKQLGADGVVRPCHAPQCGGFTLEAELGIVKNSNTEPDFLGWEIKQHAVTDFQRTDSAKAITLMTPEPTGGYYRDAGVEAFIRKYGYPDKNGRPDRLNFGGIYRVGIRHQGTKLRMVLTGYDSEQKRIANPEGSVQLIDDLEGVAAEWSFSSILAHWSRKHAKAVYVPSMTRKVPVRQYCYGPVVRLGMETDSLRLLSALADGSIYYDPGIKLESISESPKAKRRSQFRIASREISCLYKYTEKIAVCDDG